ncbi:MAG: serine hydrolase domain-containing protein [Promethearchaeota archaeon]
MDSSILENNEKIMTKNNVKYIDSISIIRNGYIVYDRFYSYYNYSDMHILNSITKSVTSILIGIANHSGFITNLDEPIVNIFSNRTFANMNAKKEAITIQDLLEMRSGLEWNTPGLFSEYPVRPQDYEFHSNHTNSFEYWSLNFADDDAKLITSDDWVQFVLDKPMEDSPGLVFKYNTGVSHLLQVIIKIKTGMDPQTFAEDYLFTPLNITNYHWWKDPQGVIAGGHGLWLHPYDIAKFGYLYLHNGSWGGQTIVPEDWVHQSVTPPAGTGYGFQWWINTKAEYYRGLGIGGQILLVQPKTNLVVVITSTNYLGGWSDYSLQFTLIDKHIIPAVVTINPTTTTTPGTTSTTTTIEPTSTNGISILLVFIIFVSLVIKKRH